jgi:hypothetical protein
MTNLTRAAPLFTALLLAACADATAPRSPRAPVAPQRAVAGHSGCYTVAFNVTATLMGPLGATGVVTGDLEGTQTIEFDGSSVGFAGKTVSISGTATWTITGGVVPAPLSFTTTFDNRNLLVDRPGSPATLFENIGTHRALAGVAMANLNYQGTFTLVPAPVADHDYRGVLCL